MTLSTGNYFHFETRGFSSFKKDAHQLRGSIDGLEMVNYAASIGIRWQPGTAELPPHVPGHIGCSVVPAVESDVARWFRCSLSVAGPFVCRCLTSVVRHLPPVSTSRSPNRTGTFNASSSRRKHHVFAYVRLRLRWASRSRPNRWWSVRFSVPTIVSASCWVYCRRVTPLTV